MTAIMQGEGPHTELDIIKSIKNAIITNSHSEFKAALEHIEIEKVTNTLFFHKGVLLHLIALHCDVQMLNILKRKYMFCNAYLGMPVVYPDNSFNRLNNTALNGEIIKKLCLKKIPEENLQWLFDNDYLNKRHDDSINNSCSIL